LSTLSVVTFYNRFIVDHVFQSTENAALLKSNKINVLAKEF